jgi:predicted DNA-binding protein (MmcQ/YjbR family)
MRLEALRSYCLSLPHTQEKIQWGDHLLFTVEGKMYCITTFEPVGPHTKISFKCDPEAFAELLECEGIIPAPYLARNQWVALTEWDALPAAELKQHIRASYELVIAKLPKRKRAALGI